MGYPLYRWLLLMLGLVVSLVFLWLGFRNLNFAELIDVIATIQVGWLLIAVGVYFFAIYILTWRWYYLLRPVKDVHANRLYPIVVIGYMGNNIYPARIGEILRAYVLKRNADVPYAPSLATIVVERIFDGLVMLMFIFSALLFVEFDDPTIETAIYVMAPLFFAALIVFSIFALRPELTRRIYTWVFNTLVPMEGIREKLLGLADHFMSGLETLRTPRLLGLTWLSSILSWTIEASTYWIVLQAFDFEVNFWVLALVMGLANLATVLPSTPGYVGTFHGVVVLTLTAFGVLDEQAGAYAIVMHAVLWLPITLLGFYYLGRQGMNWRDLNRVATIESSEAAA